jgi:hypothetical protein
MNKGHEAITLWGSARVYEVENAEIIEKTRVRLIPLERIRKILQFTGFTNVHIFAKAESPWNAVLAG